MYYEQPGSHFGSTQFPMYRHTHNAIKVTGEGSISVAPNRAMITLGVVTENMNLQTAQAENANAMEAIIAALVAIGIPKENIQTTQYQIETQYDYPDGKQVFRGYKVTHLLTITIDQIEKTGLVVDTAVSNGANTVSNIRFSVVHAELYYNQALSLAVRDSYQKAVTIAKTLDVTLSRVPYEVQEISHAAEPVPSPIAFRTATPIQPGELKIVAAVRAEYAYFSG